jgi:hypothetical protein
MGKIKFGALVVGGRGKIGGTVMSHNRGGDYLRNKVTPVNPKSAPQTLVRNRFASFSSGWRNLSVANQLAWIAATPNYQKSDIFSDMRTPSGMQLYQRLNNNLISSGGTAITSPAPNKGVSQVTIGALTYTSGTPALSLAYSANVPALTRVKVFATPPLSAGIFFVKSQFRLISTLAPAATSPANILAAYTAKFGTVGAVGTKIFVGLVFVDQTSGLSSPMQTTSAVAAS